MIEMNETYVVEKTDTENNQEVKIDPFEDRIPVDESLPSEIPAGESEVTVAQIDEVIVPEAPTSEPRLDRAEFSEKINHDIPVVVPSTALLGRDESEHFRTRWNEIQGMFVDEPRSAVTQADGLVSEVIEQITQMFATEHSLLEGQWNQGDDVSTEDLRMALQRYRSFFNRLVV
jgi:hypothetical protein